VARELGCKPSLRGKGLGEPTLYVSAAPSVTFQGVVVPAGFIMVQRQYDSSGRAVPGGKNAGGGAAGPCGKTLRMIRM
jgi:hypothetical protein